jgi:hypothetical protein
MDPNKKKHKFPKKKENHDDFEDRDFNQGYPNMNNFPKGDFNFMNPYVYNNAFPQNYMMMKNMNPQFYQNMEDYSKNNIDDNLIQKLSKMTLDDNENQSENPGTPHDMAFNYYFGGGGVPTGGQKDSEKSSTGIDNLKFDKGNDIHPMVNEYNFMNQKAQPKNNCKSYFNY